MLDHIALNLFLLMLMGKCLFRVIYLCVSLSLCLSLFLFLSLTHFSNPLDCLNEPQVETENTRNYNFIMSSRVTLVKWFSLCTSLFHCPFFYRYPSTVVQFRNPFKLRLARVSDAKSTKGVKIKQATLQDYKL